MNKDDIIKDYLESNREEIPDKGFSENVLRKLPSRNNYLKSTIILIFFWIGCGLSELLAGSWDTLVEQFELNPTIGYTIGVYSIGMTIIFSTVYAFYQAEKA